MRTLVVTEKPNVAERIANSLGKAKAKAHGGISYYEVGDTVVAPAVGHIFGLREVKSKGWTYPVFDIEWVPSHLISKDSEFTKKYLDNLKFLAKDCEKFINACDYDVEGEVIGFNVIKYACNADPLGDKVGRVRYSTLTKESILKAFEKVGKIDSGLAYAGLTRHTLDWYWGINLSRALSTAARKGKSFTTLSVGRVQGPTLKMLSDRELVIQAFKSEKYWEVEMLCHKDLDFSSMYEAGKLVFSLSEKADVKSVAAGFKALGLLEGSDAVVEVLADSSEENVERWNVKTKGGVTWVLTREQEDKEDVLKVRREGAESEISLWVEPDAKDPTKLDIYSGEIKTAKEAQRVKDACGPKAKVTDVGSKKYKQKPPFPFDLTTLQTEAYRHFGIDPRRTLEIAQELYTNAWISYPRTSSQQIPADIDCRKIISDLSKQKDYKELCGSLLKLKELKPANGEKNDPAHPAIHPTGEVPGRLESYPAKIYDLIVRRFMAAFGEEATRQTMTVKLDNNGEKFSAKGSTTVDKGWHVYYGPYAKFEEVELPNLNKGDIVDVTDVLIHDKETKPPKRYTPASIIREMEKRNLGTKATRSNIVDILFKRGYLNGKSIEVTKLGLSVVDALGKYCPQVLSETLTRKFEDEMEKITSGKMDSEKVLTEGKAALTEILTEFKASEAKIGDALSQSVYDSRRQAASVGKCPKCESQLIIRSSKMWQFIGCSGYPKCTQTWSLPRDPYEKSKECKECGYSTLIMKPKGKRRYTICVNPDCPSKKNGSNLEEVGKCPKCESKLIVRMSRYGTKFIGCSGYPKCTNLWPLPRDQFEKSGQCTVCGYPEIKVTPEKKDGYTICVNPECTSRKKA